MTKTIMTRVPTPEYDEQVLPVMKEGGIVTFSYCGMMGRARWNKGLERVEVSTPLNQIQRHQDVRELVFSEWKEPRYEFIPDACMIRSVEVEVGELPPPPAPKEPEFVYVDTVTPKEALIAETRELVPA